LTDVSAETNLSAKKKSRGLVEFE